MGESWVVLWGQERCTTARRDGLEGQPLTLLFGGPHLSHPNPRRFKVQPGDLVYPVSVRQGVLYLLACVHIKEICTLTDFKQSHPATWSEVNGCRSLLWSCTDDVAIGSTGTPLRFDYAVPADVLTRVQFRSKKEAVPLQPVEDGKLKSVLSLQGVYRRLSPPSAADFARLLPLLPEPYLP